MRAEGKTPTLSVTICTGPKISACMVSKGLGAVVQLFTSMGSIQLPKHIMAFETCCRGSGTSSWTGFQEICPMPFGAGRWEPGRVF